jgi:hypothetical protein
LDCRVYFSECDVLREGCATFFNKLLTSLFGSGLEAAANKATGDVATDQRAFNAAESCGDSRQCCGRKGGLTGRTERDFLTGFFRSETRCNGLTVRRRSFQRFLRHLHDALVNRRTSVSASQSASASTSADLSATIKSGASRCLLNTFTRNAAGNCATNKPSPTSADHRRCGLSDPGSERQRVGD